jgi:uncharacterized protein YndB with AHSA1/START domain
MADILHLVPIAAAPDEVYRALTTAGGARAWWTVDADLEPEVGSLAQFRFEGGAVVFNMRVDKLEGNKSITWQVEEPAPPEWVGTMVSFDLEPANGGTNLLFGHHDWGSTEGSFPSINYNWAYYLTSLKEYLEKGKGFPHGS